jgi:hypothetical protein
VNWITQRDGAKFVKQWKTIAMDEFESPQQCQTLWPQMSAKSAVCGDGAAVSAAEITVK